MSQISNLEEKLTKQEQGHLLKMKEIEEARSTLSVKADSLKKVVEEKEKAMEVESLNKKKIQEKKKEKSNSPCKGLEPVTLRLKV